MTGLTRRIGIITALLTFANAALAAEGTTHRYIDEVTGFALREAGEDRPSRGVRQGRERRAQGVRLRLHLHNWLINLSA